MPRFSQFIACPVKQFIASGVVHNQGMRSLKDTFAINLKARMVASRGVYDTAAKVAAKARWPRGDKAGENVSPRQVLYAMTPGNTGPSPTLDFVQAIAEVFRVEAWEMITEPGDTRRRIIEKLLNGQTAPR